MKIKGKIIALSSIIFLLITIVTFIYINKDNEIEDKMEGRSMQSKSLNILMLEPDSYLPLASKNKYVHEVSNLIFEGLTSRNDELKSEPNLAKLLVTDDNLTWDVYLRDNVYFHNGDNFNASDVIYTVDKIKELGENSYFLYNVQNIKNIKKISDYQIEITLNDYDNFLPDKLNFPILPSKVYRNIDLTSSNKLIGTGPYKVNYIDDSSILLVRNNQYYKESKGNIAEINVKIASKTRPGFDLLKIGEIDIADTNTEVGAYGRSAYDSTKYFTNEFEGIVFNPDNEILSDSILRLAIILGINRDYIIENELNGYGVYADIPVNPDSYLYSSTNRKYAFNPERAQDFLSNSGWELNNGIRTKDGNKLEFNILINNEIEGNVNKAGFIKNDLEKIGIRVNVISKDSLSYSQMIKENNFDLVITDWAITDYPEFLYNFESNSVNNVFGFNNEEYDYLVYLAKREILAGKQLEYFAKMQQILYNELPMAGLYFETSTVFCTKILGNQLKPQINNIYHDIDNFIVYDIEQNIWLIVELMILSRSKLDYGGVLCFYI